MAETSVNAPIGAVTLLPPAPRLSRRVWRVVRAQPLGAIAAGVLLTMTLLAIFAPQIAPFSPNEIHRRAALQAPNATYWFGTDNLGRDIFSRVLYGARISLLVSVTSVALGTLAGTIIGLTSGYFGGKYDLVVQRLLEIWMSLPGLVLALIVVAVLGQSLRNVILTIAISLTPSFSRVIRGAVLAVRFNLYVEAARATGVTDLRMLARYILPNVFPAIMVVVSVAFGGALLVESSLSFLGLGPPPPAPTWGAMLSGDARQHFERAPWFAVFPGLAISLTVLSLNLIGDSLRDLLDPRQRGTR